MLSSPRNPPAKTLRPSGSLRLTHQLKFNINPWKERSRKRRSDRPNSVSILKRNKVAQVPFIRRDLPIGVGIQASQHEQELLFGKVEVHQRERKGMKGQIPCRIP